MLLVCEGRNTAYCASRHLVPDAEDFAVGVEQYDLIEADWKTDGTPGLVSGSGVTAVTGAPDLALPDVSTDYNASDF